MQVFSCKQPHFCFKIEIFMRLLPKFLHMSFFFSNFAAVYYNIYSMTRRKAATSERTRLQSVTRKATESKANSLAFLQRAGIVSKSGHLTPMYQ